MSHEDFAYIMRKAEEERRRREIERQKRLANRLNRIRTTGASVSAMLEEYQRQVDAMCSKAKSSGISHVRDADALRKRISEFRSQISSFTVPTDKFEDERFLEQMGSKIEAFRSSVKSLTSGLAAAENRVRAAVSAIGAIGEIRNRVDSQIRTGRKNSAEIQNMMRKYEVDGTESYSALQGRFEGFEKELSRLSKLSCDTDSVDDLKSILEQYQKLSSRISQDDSSFDRVAGDIRNAYSDRLSSEISVLIEKIRANDEKRRQEKADAENIARLKEADEKRQKQDEKKQKIIDLARREFDELLSEPAISSKVTESIQALLARYNALKDESGYELSDCYAISIQPRIKKIRAEIKAYRELAEKFNELYAEYFVLAQVCQEEIKDYALDESSLALLQGEIVRLRAAAEQRDNQLMAAEALKLSLEEMGYEMIGEETDIPESIASSRLFRDEKGNGIAAVTRANGSCSIEYGALALEDRELTHDEARQVANDTKTFCDKHKKLHELLARNGVEARDISRMAPTAENAILINAKNYNISEKVEKEIAARSAKVAQTAAAEQRQLRAGGED
ncbi:MAG: hypothetical protein IJ523_07645 [Succinivibrionaceae bacterium]|nr:hypothetical protein [Succinivibrionaceae bacterium]